MEAREAFRQHPGQVHQGKDECPSEFDSEFFQGDLRHEQAPSVEGADDIPGAAPAH
jgi:hypothetical protein